VAFFLSLALHNSTPPSGGPQERVSRWLGGAWVVLGLVALAAGVPAVLQTQSRSERGLAFIVLIASAAMPVTLIILIVSGYFADSS
jgi:uncharacterized membrane-anchored protein